MIEVYRVVEDQAKINSYRATEDREKAIQLEILIDLTKPPLRHTEWHDLVATPFRYELPTLPAFKARFRPPYFTKNVFYAATHFETALYEYSYHLMRQRVHLQVKSRRVKNETGTRTGFSVNADDMAKVDIRGHQNITAILDRSDYSASHAFINENPGVDFIVYPSVRDPQHRDNVAVMEIAHLSKKVNSEHPLSFFYDYRKKLITWIDSRLSIAWTEVC
jgi:hypothetical protein